MPWFSSSSPFDHDIEKATDEKNTSEDWAVIMEICDQVGTTPNGAKDCLRSIVKRLNHVVPHVAMQALTVLDACINNCGKVFHLEVASREFETEIKRLLTGGKSHQKVAEKTKQLLKKWSEADFKSDPQLSLIPSLYNQLKSDGLDFTVSETPKKSVAAFSKDPNVVQSNQEEADLAKAIELSLKENQTSPPKSNSSGSNNNNNNNNRSAGIYPSARPPSPSPVASHKEVCKVRAIFDFEAAEDNELSFKEGEIIQVLDDSDPNWWKGAASRGEGLFPANFVTADLNAEPEQYKIPEKKAVQFNEVVQVKTLEAENLPVEADEEKIDRLLHSLHEADPTGDRGDADEMLFLEEQCHAMGPLLDQELEKIDKKHAALTRLSHELMESLSLYHSLMRDYPVAGPPPPPPPSQQTYAFPAAAIHHKMVAASQQPSPYSHYGGPPTNVHHHQQQQQQSEDSLPSQHHQQHFGGQMPPQGYAPMAHHANSYQMMGGAVQPQHLHDIQQQQMSRDASNHGNMQQQQPPPPMSGGGMHYTSSGVVVGSGSEGYPMQQQQSVVVDQYGGARMGMMAGGPIQGHQQQHLL